MKATRVVAVLQQLISQKGDVDVMVQSKKGHFTDAGSIRVMDGRLSESAHIVADDEAVNSFVGWNHTPRRIWTNTEFFEFDQMPLIDPQAEEDADRIPLVTR